MVASVSKRTIRSSRNYTSYKSFFLHKPFHSATLRTLRNSNWRLTTNKYHPKLCRAQNQHFRSIWTIDPKTAGTPPSNIPETHNLIHQTKDGTRGENSNVSSFKTDAGRDITVGGRHNCRGPFSTEARTICMLHPQNPVPRNIPPSPPPTTTIHEPF